LRERRVPPAAHQKISLCQRLAAFTGENKSLVHVIHILLKLEEICQRFLWLTDLAIESTDDLVAIGTRSADQLCGIFLAATIRRKTDVHQSR